MTLKVLKLIENAFLPVRANQTDAGADLISPINIIIPPHGSARIPLGIAIELPVGTAGFIFARSGLGANEGITPRNKVGVIDEKYRGEIIVVLKNDTNEHYVVQRGQKIAQLVIMPVFTPVIQEVIKLDMTGDRKGGFGSTGK